MIAGKQLTHQTCELCWELEGREGGYGSFRREACLAPGTWIGGLWKAPWRMKLRHWNCTLRNLPLIQCFSAWALWTFFTNYSSLWGAPLCFWECLGEFLASVHWPEVPSPNCDNQKCFQCRDWLLYPRGRVGLATGMKKRKY